MLFLSLMVWAISVTGGIWFLLTLREIRDEVRLLRQYLQGLYGRGRETK
jgi:hypothetical protein